MNTIDQLVEQAIRDRLFPGCVIAWSRLNGERQIWTFGYETYEAAQAVRQETLYDVASVTKSIPTASLAAQLMEEGKLSLETLIYFWN